MKKQFPLSFSFFADNSKNYKSILLAFILLIVECLIFYFYLMSFLSVVFFILLHCVIILISCLFLYRSWKKQEDLRYPFLLALSLFGAGPFGLLGFIIFSFLYSLFSLFSTPLKKWFADLFPVFSTSSAITYQRIKAGWDDYKKPSEITPFQDIFNYGTLLQKQAVLDAVIKDFKPDHAKILKKALSDPSNVIRIQAAAIKSKIDLDFDSKLKKLLKEENLTDTKTLLKIAEHYDLYALYGFLDHAQEEEVRKQAIHYYREYLQKYPQNQRVWVSIGRIFFRMKEEEKVIDWFENDKKKFEEIPANAFSWYLESLYNLGEFKKLNLLAREKFEKMKKNVKLEEIPTDEILECIESWAHGT